MDGAQCKQFIDRLYMEHNAKHGNSTANSRWKLYLDPALVEGDFWSKHYRSLGSTKCTITIALIVWFLTALMWAIPSQMSLHIDYWDNGPLITACFIIMASTHLICVAFCTILWHLTPRISDVFYLRYELKLLIILIWPITCWYIAIMIAQSVVAETDQEIVTYCLMVLQTFSASVGYVLYASVSTIFILNKLDTESKAKSTSFQNLKNVCDIILHRDYFELFVQYLIREFSTELILCFVELIQFKQQLNKVYRLRIHNDSQIQMEIITESEPAACDHETAPMRGAAAAIDFTTTYLQLDMNPNIPKSHLIWSEINDENEMNVETYLKIAYLLFDKYINDENGSELEINISGEMRSEYKNKMCDMESFISDKATMKPQELFEYFDVVIEELHQLLCWSFHRFMRSDFQINVTRPIFSNTDTEQLADLLKIKSKSRCN